MYCNLRNVLQHTSTPPTHGHGSSHCTGYRGVRQQPDWHAMPPSPHQLSLRNGPHARLCGLPRAGHDLQGQCLYVVHCFFLPSFSSLIKTYTVCTLGYIHDCMSCVRLIYQFCHVFITPFCHTPMFPCSHVPILSVHT